jgi:hypothetical protein
MHSSHGKAKFYAAAPLILCLLLSMVPRVHAQQPALPALRAATLQVRKAGKWENYVVWKVPINPSDHIVTTGSPVNVVYLLVRDDLDGDSKGQVIWYRYAYDSSLLGRKSRIAMPGPAIDSALAWNPERKLLYLVEASFLGGHAGIHVYEIDPAQSYGTYPPLALAPPPASGASRLQPPEPIVSFDPAEPNHIFVGGENLAAITEPNRLLVSLWTMEELGTHKFAVYFAIDLNKRTWDRVSIK